VGKWILSPSVKVSRTLIALQLLGANATHFVLHGYFYDIAVKSRPVLAATFTVVLVGFFYVASHTVSEDRAAAASHQIAEQQQPKPVPPKPVEPQHVKPKAETKQEERRNDHARHEELCKKLEQRRAELREEKKANKQQNPE